MKLPFFLFSALTAFRLCAVSVGTAPMVVDSFFRGAWEVYVGGASADASFEVLDAGLKHIAGPFSVDTFQVTDVEPWSDEKPSVYILRVTDGSESKDIPFGFFTRETAHRSLFVNGRRVRVKLGPGELGGNAAPDDGTLSREEALTKGIYLLSPGELEEIDMLKPLDSDGATRHLFQNWSITATDNLRRISVSNRNAFTGSDSLLIEWTLLRDGEKESHGRMDMLPVAPGCTSARDMPAEALRALFKEGSVAIRFDVTDGRRTLASDQIEMMQTRDFSWIGGERGKGRVSFSGGGDSMVFAAGKTHFSFSKESTMSTVLARKGFFGKTKAMEGVFPCILGVAPASPPAIYPVSSVDESDGVLSFSSCFSSAGRTTDGAFCAVSVSGDWTVYPNGRIGCVFLFDRKGDCGRCGMGFVVSGSPSKVEWYGAGPWCTAPGSTEGAFAARWTAGIRDGMTFEDVRGIKIGAFTLRTLQSPFSSAILHKEGKTVLLVFPGGDDATLAVALSPSDDSLCALTM